MYSLTEVSWNFKSALICIPLTAKSYEVCFQILIGSSLFLYLFILHPCSSFPSLLSSSLSSTPLYLLVILISSSESCCSVNLSIISLPYLYFSYFLLGFVFDPWYESPLRWLISKNKFSFYRLPSVSRLFSFSAEALNSMHSQRSVWSITFCAAEPCSESPCLEA